MGRSVAVLAATLVALAGCTMSGTGEDEWPDGSWRGVQATCPTLDGDAAKRVALTGEGYPGVLTQDRGSINKIDCTWGDPDGQIPSLHAEVTIYRVQKAADAHYSGISVDDDLVPGLGDHANAVVLPPSVKIYVQSRNAVAVIDFRHPTDNAVPDGRQRTDAVDLAADVLNDLRADR
ncbi:hypothetical protein [Virgisporangium aurantiacum]|uniref:hypothetical protein n=1 Tax=Virgisporangium aurantiacum TaxID=175570 RepID=UPI00194EC493|nr:hypothetical protein [Virgisporangium aurantiacum]